jgi:hypothetical protein
LDFWPGIAFIFRQTGNLLFSIGSHFSLTSLAAAFLIATAFFVWQRVRRGRRVRVRTILRALSRNASCTAARTKPTLAT